MWNLTGPMYFLHVIVQVIQAALKGLQNCFSGGKWKFGGAEELGSILASLKVTGYQPFLSVCLSTYHKN